MSKSPDVSMAMTRIAGQLISVHSTLVLLRDLVEDMAEKIEGNEDGSRAYGTVNVVEMLSQKIDAMYDDINQYC